MAIDVLDNPFQDRVETTLDDTKIRNVAPAMPDTKIQDLRRAANQEVWNKQEGINEKFVFDKRLMSVAQMISAELGPFTLDTFDKAQELVGAGVLRIINEGDRTGSFRGNNASGGSQWDIQGISTQTFDGSPSSRVYTTGTTGNIDVIPNFGGTAGSATTSLDTDVQSIFITGFYASTNPRAIEHARIDIDDGESRTSTEKYSHQQLGTLQADVEPSVEYINDDDSFDINATAVQDTSTDFFPYGVDINTANNFPGLGTSA